MFRKILIRLHRAAAWRAAQGKVPCFKASLGQVSGDTASEASADRNLHRQITPPIGDEFPCQPDVRTPIRCRDLYQPATRMSPDTTAPLTRQFPLGLCVWIAPCRGKVGFAHRSAKAFNCTGKRSEWPEVLVPNRYESVHLSYRRKFHFQEQAGGDGIRAENKGG